MIGKGALARNWFRITVPVTLAGLLGAGSYMLSSNETDNQNEVSAIARNGQPQDADSVISEAERIYLDLPPEDKVEIDRQRIALETDERRSTMLTKLFEAWKTPKTFQPFIRRAILDEDVGCEDALGEQLVLKKLDVDVDPLINECHVMKERIVALESQPLLVSGPE